MNNKKMNCQVVCVEKSARRIEGTMQMAHTQKSGAGARMNAPRSFGQTGRSMLEMLGVLAIIGVLTIGGLIGYQYAMNKHKANTILNDVSLAMADLTVLDPDGGAITRRAVAFRPDSGLAMESERTADGNNIVYVSGVAKAVCQILIQIQPTDAYETITDGDLNALTTCADTQAMAFGSKETAEGPDTPECQNDADCGANQVCQDGRCVDKPAPSDPCENVECFNDGTCNDGSCDCVNGYTGTSCEIAPQCNDTIACASPKQCENYICVCPTIANCKTLNNSTCVCNLCEDGYEVVDGKCVKNDCPTGQKSVTNYDSAGNNIGSVCCEVKEDEVTNNCNKWAENYSTFNYETRTYTAVGAIEGTCCGGQKYVEHQEGMSPDGTCSSPQISEWYKITASYKIRVNNGVAYCANDYQRDRLNSDGSVIQDSTDTYGHYYVSDTKYCSEGSNHVLRCYCSTSGDPKNGSSCNP